MFNNPRYCTRGISETVPLLTQIILWDLIDSMEVEEKDYLQVFKLTATDKTQHVTHTQEQPPYNYRYLRNYYWDYPDPAEHEPQDVKQLKDFAASIGVNREYIDLLLCYGYFVEEIEEMLYHPGEFEQALAEILDECAYDYCGEF